MKRVNDSKIGIELVIFVATIVFGGSAKGDFAFGEPVNLRSVIPVLDPLYESIDCLSYDGLEMYIESDRPGGSGSLDLWVLRRASIDDDWGPPENLGPAINSPTIDNSASISTDGLTLYFGSGRSGGYGSHDIWMITRATTDTPWGQPVNLGPKINSSRGDAGPRISADDLELYFQSWRPGGYGEADIYMAKRATVIDSWGDPVNLGPVVNSPYSDECAFLSPDGLLLLFSDHFMTGAPRSGGYGGSDIWMTRRMSLSDPWQSPVSLGPGINSSIHELGPCTSSDGSTLHFITARTTDFATWENWQASIEPICDFNGDGKVDGKDVLCMAGNWDTDDPVCDIGPLAWGDGVVDLNDLVVLTEYLGTEVVDPTLAAHWRLDEADGITARESVGGDDAYVLGGAAWEPAGGQMDGAILLDGVDDCVVSGLVFDPAEGPFSVLVWVMGGAPGQVIISEPTGANWLMADAEGKLMTELKGSSRSDGPLISETIITDDQWHRIGLVWEGSRRMLYADGVVVAEDLQDALEGSGGGQYIGTGQGMEPASFWAGLIDDVRIYNRAVRP
jgi:hypothetical protein